jgi:DNA invertase Pin-like site-specific DNA recombinase
MQSHKPTKAFGYLRVFGKRQPDKDLARQRASIKAFADGRGIEIAGWFEERGVALRKWRIARRSKSCW